MNTFYFLTTFIDILVGDTLDSIGNKLHDRMVVGVRSFAENALECRRMSR